jgi:hypothetical protein
MTGPRIHTNAKRLEFLVMAVQICGEDLDTWNADHGTYVTPDDVDDILDDIRDHFTTEPRWKPDPQ